jgi:hypothetical protein
VDEEGGSNKEDKEREVVSVLNGLRDRSRGEEMLTELILGFSESYMDCRWLVVRENLVEF